MAAGGVVGERRRQKRAADTIAEHVRLLLPCLPLHGLGRRQDALGHVVLERLVRETLVRIDPGDHEDGEALVHHPFDERLRRRQVQNIELVDPRRHDQQRRAVHLVRGRRVLDQLQHVVLEDDLARRHGEILADAEGRRVRLADLQQVTRALHVGHELLQALDQIGAVGGERLAHHLRIGRGEVRRREGARHLAQVVGGALARAVIEALRVGERLLRPVRGDEIALLPEIEIGVRRPVGVAKPRVARLRLGDRGGLLAERAGPGIAPHIHVAAHQLALHLERPRRLRHPLFRHLAQHLGRLRQLARRAERAALHVRALHETGHDLAAVLDEAQHVTHQFLGVRDLVGAPVDVRWGQLLLHRAASVAAWRDAGVAVRSRPETRTRAPRRRSASIPGA